MNDLQAFYLSCLLMKENFSFTVRAKHSGVKVCKWIVKFK